MSYRPKYFALNELVPPDVIASRGEQAWQLMDERILRGADWLREKFGPCVINGKFGGKGFTESGLRNPLTTTGARWSQHKFGRAVDLKFLKVNVKEVYDYILANQPEARANGITTVENIIDTKGQWLHIDCRLLPETFPTNGILVVRV
jgi:hypothetical protein